ncbi:response regulator transcription factor [Mycobacterium haemophilum]|uniref:LuxR family transcriptional regulator n=1 Tax=Mycobacterium haemophilum TaxID=29311 RepID=A0A0I9THE5_9MYCO|nr:response regulator transcription factor [Mycobacterium haemophilum]AKN17637.1 LuxR family transcriptional regulator [Mycobacterium haemophilum DSM 44634]KLO29209.1 LuxR family transcriptional regulator [Mycobacterium haemophilum]KLO35813.1 LuxR family transcriptional regulator [Mycobacterium haemophilum]KLO41334.1 LuxR family transcriptional regulator [Mycobacterium haemophilum]KLO49215.1 LuxR family transcriptional regulator [Mycobacterium haemophilum]
MSKTSVSMLASDPLTREGALARLSSYPQLDVHAWEIERTASVLLVLATRITAPILSDLESIQQDGKRRTQKLVVVADEFTDEHVLRMIDLRLTGLLYRRQSNFDRIVEAIVSAAAGRLQLPERVQHYLVGRCRSISMTEPGAPGTVDLTEREVDVLRLLSDGLNTHEVAMKLNYSERTIKNIVHDMVVRLNLRNRTHAVAHALRVGVI